ncbi:hypothetical protein LIER_01487 [Lithospermum erythrorhizon]|uniref:Protein RALF-like 24 n=1 Tax=Lithospermum erythrorhizon TaxID=34254 RepID=A0AAV3NM43_LITER
MIPIIIILCFLVLENLCKCSSILDLETAKSDAVDSLLKRVCSRQMSECPSMATNEEMISESNRRMLAMQKRYISYATLRRDLVPCTYPGASYYNCRVGGEVNHYNRGCEIITRCARQITDIHS